MARLLTSDDTAAPASAVLDPDELRRMNAYWRAANYLSVGPEVQSWRWRTRG